MGKAEPLTRTACSRRCAGSSSPFILLPGGVAQIIKNSAKPVHELSPAIAGPLVNVVIAGVLVPPLGLRLGPMPLTSHGLLPAGLANTPSLNTLLIWLFSANASRVLFSLIPAFPPGLLFSGGRVNSEPVPLSGKRSSKLRRWRLALPH